MGENNIKKPMLSREEYGDLVADCAESAVNTAVGSFILGIIGVPVSLKYLDKFIVTRQEVKVCAALVAAVGLAIYTTKKVRINCEKKTQEIYDI